MSRFKIGQKIICIRMFDGVYSLSGNKAVGYQMPKYKSVYTVVGYSPTSNTHLILKELSSGYFLESRFAPIEPNVRTKELAETMVEHLGGVKKEVEHIKI